MSDILQFLGATTLLIVLWLGLCLLGDYISNMTAATIVKQQARINGLELKLRQTRIALAAFDGEKE